MRRENTVIDSMDHKTNPKSARAGDADPSVDSTSGEPTGQQLQSQAQVPAATKLIDLSWPQVVGGAMAAMTAAVLGSRLGVAGTVIGAALASVCAAVFGSIYTTSIRRTQRMARAALTMAQSQRSRSRPLPAVTTLLEPTDATRSMASDSFDTTTDRVVETRPKPEGRRPLRPVLITSIVGATAVFVVAIAAIAGFELASGRTLDGNKGTTTVSEVLRGSSGAGTNSKKHDPANGPTSDPSASPSAGTSAGPQDGNSPADQASSGSSNPPASAGPTESAPAGSGDTSSGDQNSTGQGSGSSQSGSGSGSSESGTSGSGASGSSDSSGSDSTGSTGSVQAGS
jgi:uncharacterized membrane protein YgcG